MKLKQLIESKSALESLIKSRIPISLAWEIKTFIQKINPELQSYEEVRVDKVKEYGEIDENGNIRVKQENLETYMKEINELLEREVSIDVPSISKEYLSSFKDKDGNEISMSVEDLIILDWLIK